MSASFSVRCSLCFVVLALNTGCGVFESKSSRPPLGYPVSIGRTTGHFDFAKGSTVQAYAEKNRQIQLTVGTKKYTLRGYDAQADYVADLAFDPTARYLVSAHGIWKTVLRVWDVSNGRLVATRRLSTIGFSSFDGLSISPDGKYVAVPCKRIEVFTLPDLQPIGQLDAGGDGFTCAFSSDGNRLAGTGLSGTLTVWEVPSMTEIARKNGIGRGYVAFQPNGNLLALLSMTKRRLLLLDAKSLKSVREIRETEGPFAFSPDGKELAVFNRLPRLASIYRVEDGKELQVIQLKVSALLLMRKCSAKLQYQSDGKALIMRDLRGGLWKCKRTK